MNDIRRGFVCGLLAAGPLVFALAVSHNPYAILAGILMSLVCAATFIKGT